MGGGLHRRDSLKDAGEGAEGGVVYRNEERATKPCARGVVLAQEEEKNKIQNDLRILTERLSRINESLARKVSAHRISAAAIGVAARTARALGSCCFSGGAEDARATATADRIAQRVRQDDRRDRGGVHEDPRVLTDATQRAQARDCEPCEEEADFLVSCEPPGRQAVWRSVDACRGNQWPRRSRAWRVWGGVLCRAFDAERVVVRLETSPLLDIEAAVRLCGGQVGP